MPSHSAISAAVKAAKAKDFAIHWHCKVNNQKYGNEPYSKHLEDVVGLVRKYLPLVIKRLNLHRDHRKILLASAWLHDVLEDCDQFNVGDIEGFFGPSVAQIVETLTGKGSRSERVVSGYYERVRADKFAMFVKMCDRLANIKDAAKKWEN